jgi:NADH-quinone oxidoreductase subunit C
MNASPLASCALLCLIKENPARSGSAWSAFLAPDALAQAAQTLYDAGYHLEDVCGLDALEAAVCVYHFDHFDRPGRIALRVTAPHENPVFPSIAHIFQGAAWHERETADFYDFHFEGHPNLIPLLLPDDLAHLAPLRKEAADKAPLRALLSAPGQELLFKADGFSLLDPPPTGESAPAATKQEGLR